MLLIYSSICNFFSQKGYSMIMNKKKFLYIFLPIIAVVVAVVSIVGTVVASEKSEGLDLAPYLAVGANGSDAGDSGAEAVSEEITYTIKGCKFSGANTHINIKSGTSYTIMDCTFSGSESSAIVSGGEILTISGCEFDNCSSTTNGGAINCYLSSGGNLNISNSIFINCSADDSGGAIYAMQPITISDSLFSRNTAEKDGGAICNNNTVHNTFTNTKFLENQANSNGGAIRSMYSCSFTDCVLAANTSGANGGAVYSSASLSLVTLDNTVMGEWTDTETQTEYDGNEAAESGGAIWSAVGCEIENNSKLSGNKSGTGTGGAICVINYYNISRLKIADSEISGNKALGTGSGGGIYYSDSGYNPTNLSITNSKIINNSCNSSGGGIYFNIGSQESNTLTITDSNIDGNTSSTNGGGMYFSSTSTNRTTTECVISGTSISNNTAYDNGGAVYFDASTISSLYTLDSVTMTNCTVDGNICSTNAGGGIYLSKGSVSFDGGSISNNKGEGMNVAASYGGGVYIASGSEFTFKSGTMLGNYNFGAGNFYNEGTLNIQGGTIDGNGAPGAGGYGYDAIYNSGVVNMSGGVIQNFVYSSSSSWACLIAANTFNMSGGSIQNNVLYGIFESLQLFNMTGGTISSNTTNRIFYGVNNLNIQQGRILNNTIWSSSETNPIIYASAGDNIVLGKSDGTGIVEIAGNRSYGNGGVIQIKGYTTSGQIANLGFPTITIYDGVTIGALTSSVDGVEYSGNTNNLGSGSGGAIYATDTNFYMYGGLITGNYSISSGGGIYLENSITEGNLTPTVEFSGGTISNNICSINGGGAYIASYVNNSKAVFTADCVIDSNTATMGGGLYLDGYIDLNATVSNNVAMNNGGGIYASLVSGFVGGEIFENSADYGGGIYANSLINITCELYGEAVDEHAVGDIKKTLHIYDNEANYNGGGIYSNTSIYINGEYSTTQNEFAAVIEDNKAVLGGGIYINTNGIESSLKDCLISGNVASGDYGGGIYFAGGNGENASLNIKASTNSVTVSGNKCTNGNGGGIYNNGIMNVNGKLVCSSNQSKNGAGIYLNGNGEITNTTNIEITDNIASNMGGGLMTITGSKFNPNDSTTITISGNKASQGGGIYLNNSITLGDGCSFTVSGNTAHVGGGMFVNNGTISVEDATDKLIVTGNTADNPNTADNTTDGDGAGVYFYSGTELANLAISGNNGHGLFIAAADSTIKAMTIETNAKSGIYVNTTTTINGGTVKFGNDAVKIYRNTAELGGGILFAPGSASSTLTLTGYIEISSNTATSLGGGIYAQTGVLNLNITNFTELDHNNDPYNINGITSNKASLGGGVYAAHGAAVNQSCYIASNSITSGGDGFGGGVFISNATYTITVDGQVNNNITNVIHGGGVAVAAGGTLNLYGTIKGNTCTTNGGGIYLQEASTINVFTGASISENTATNYFGGGIYSNASYVNISGGGISSNNATSANGGGIYATNESQIQMTNGEIYYNEALQGGGIFIDTGSITINGSYCDIYSNIATEEGGGLKAINIPNWSAINLDTGKFRLNRAGNFGGAVALSSCATTSGYSMVIWMSFYGNRLTGADGEGGAIGLDNGNCVFAGEIYGGSLADQVPSDNNAAYGGGILVTTTGNLRVSSEASINNCKATAGGGIVSMGTLNLEGAVNTCSADAGGGVVNGGTFNFSGTIADCTATSTTVSNSIANIGTLNLYKAASIDNDICIGQASASWFTKVRGVIVVKEDLQWHDPFIITFGDVDYDTKQITDIGTASDCFSYYYVRSSTSSYSMKPVIKFDDTSWIQITDYVSLHFETDTPELTWFNERKSGALYLTGVNY